MPPFDPLSRSDFAASWRCLGTVAEILAGDANESLVGVIAHVLVDIEKGFDRRGDDVLVTKLKEESERRDSCQVQFTLRKRK